LYFYWLEPYQYEAQLWEVEMPDKGRDASIVAIEAVYAALKDLDAATRRRVLSSAFALLGVEGPAVLNSSQGTSSPSREPAQPARPIGLVELINEKRPGTNAQRIAAFAYYREKAEGNPRFSRADLETYFAKARLLPARNYGRDFAEAVRAGWIHEDGAESYLTTKGIEAIENGIEGQRKYSTRKGRKIGKKVPRNSRRRKKK
jgi:hypothetical protein